MTLGDILRKHFHCKHPFYNKPKKFKDCDYVTSYEYLTNSGNKAYGKLIEVLYDIRQLLPEYGDTIEDIVEDLDFIADGEEY